MDTPPNVAAPRAVDVESPDGHRAQLALSVPTGARTGLLFVPALGVPARKYTHLAAALAQRGIAVALHELRGTGTSSVRASRTSDWGYAELLDDVRASRALLASTYPAIAWSAGGHSLGAQIAALDLALAPGAYAGLAIVASGQPWWRKFAPGRQPLVLFAYGFFRLLTVSCGYFPGDRVGFGGREARRVMRDWSRSGLSGKYAIERVDADLEAALARIETRVIALSMRDDTLAPAGAMDHLLAKMPRTTVTRDILERADHFSWMRNAGPVAQRIAAWL